MAHTEHPTSEHSHHVIPKSVLLKVFLSLVALTVITVLVAQVDLGVLNVPVALAIAGVKASLVVIFFMALKYDKKVNTLVFSVGAIFVGIFLVFTLIDTAFRGSLGIQDAQTILEQEQAAEELRERDPGAAGLRIAPADFANMGDTTQADTSVANSSADTAGAASPEAEPAGSSSAAPH